VNCPHCNKPINPAALMAHQRAASMTAKRRKDIAMNANAARWAKKEKETFTDDNRTDHRRKKNA
jgi:hypothetical protein